MVARPNDVVNMENFRSPIGNPDLAASLWGDMQPGSTNSFAPGELPRTGQVDLNSDIYPAGALTAKDVPLLDETLMKELGGADNLTFSTPEENAKNGEQPDYRLTIGEDGKMKLEKVGTGDPLADGKMNIEMDAKNKSLEEAIKNSDENLKEYIREMMVYWRQNHPDKPFPGWWNDILSRQPNIPQNPTPVPVDRTDKAPPPAQPAPEQQPAPQQSQPQRGGGGGGGGGIGGAGRGGGDGRGSGYNPGGGYRGSEGGNTSYSGATPNANSQEVLDNVATVVKVAKEVGLDPKLAVAMMLVESGGDNRAVGDNGTSFGLFQLHEGGMLTSAGLTPQQAFDPETNARVSLTALSKIDQDYQDPGAAAAASQRPADPTGYAQKVNASMDEAAELIAAAENRSTTSVASGDAPPPTEFNARLVQAIHKQDANMSGTGYCARAVQRALADVGLSEFVGSGDAWDMKGPLMNSGKFQQVSMADARPGDIIIRPPSANRGDDSVHGDISVVTARNGDRITQTNDASYEFKPDNPRYDGKAVFLRYTG